MSKHLGSRDGDNNMVSISNKDWTDFVAEVRSRLDVIDANIKNAKNTNDIQHKTLREDFSELKEFIMGKDPSSMVNRVRSLEDSRTKMNGAQIALSAVFSVAAGFMAWIFGHPVHLTWHMVSTRVVAMAQMIGHFFDKRS